MICDNKSWRPCCCVFICSFVSVIHLAVGVVYCLGSWAVGLPKRAVSGEFPYSQANIERYISYNNVYSIAFLRSKIQMQWFKPMVAYFAKFLPYLYKNFYHWKVHSVEFMTEITYGLWGGKSPGWVAVKHVPVRTVNFL